MRKHINRLKTSFLLSSLLFLVAACGGGGGGSPVNGGGGAGGGTAAEPTAVSTPVLTDSSGNTLTAVTFSEVATVTFTVTDSLDAVVPNITGTFEFDVPTASSTKTGGDSIGAQKIVASGTFATNSSGVATIDLVLNDPNVEGTGVLTLTFSQSNGDIVQIAQEFAVVAEEGQPTNLDIVLVNSVGDVSSNISTSAGSTLRITVTDAAGNPPNLLDSNNQESPLIVTLVSDNSSVALNGSVVISQAENGQESVTVTASVVDGANNLAGTITASVQIELADGTAQALTDSVIFEIVPEDVAPDQLQFVSANPSVIAIAGAGDATRPENSQVAFVVLDEGGLPIQGIDVSFALDTLVGGISLLTSSGVTNSSGQVSVTVNAGNQPAQVSVRASVTTVNGVLTESSDTLVIESGPPHQSGFSLGAVSLNPGGANFNGLTTALNVRAADAFSNPIPDGTSILFTTEYGVVEPSCTTIDGFCSVNWTSQVPREPLFSSTGVVKTLFNEPCTQNEIDVNGNVAAVDTTGIPCSSDLGQIRGGRTTILATALGNESFIDANSNGEFDIGESFVDLPEAFLDMNEDGEFGGVGTTGSCDATSSCPEEGGREERFNDLNNNGAYDVGNGIYNGTTCSATAEVANACNSDRIQVRDEVVILMSGAQPYGAFFDSAGNRLNPAIVDLRTSSIATVSFKVSDIFNGRLPAGTTLTKREGDSGGCDAEMGDATLGNTSSLGFDEFNISLTTGTNTDDVITVDVTVPASAGGSDTVTSFSFLCVSDPDTVLSGGGGTGGTTNDANIGLALTNGAGGATRSVSDAEPGELTLTLLDSSGAALANELVAVSTTIGALNPASGSQVLTNSAGQATIIVTAGGAVSDSAGVITATFTDGSVTIEETFNFEIISSGTVDGEPSTLALFLEDPDNAGVAITSISNSDPGQLQITVEDSDGDPVFGVIVSVASTVGVLSPTSGNVLTDASGEAFVDVLVGAADPGEAGSLTVTINDLSATLNFEIVDSGTTSTAGFVLSSALYNASVDLATADPSDAGADPQAANRSSTVNAVESGTYVVLVEDAVSGSPIEGAIVTVSSDVGELTPGNGRILTDVSGIASATVGAGTDDPGAAGTLTATLEDVNATVNFAIGSITLALGFDEDGDGTVESADADEINLIGVGGVTDGSTSLSATGSTTLSVTVIDNTNAAFTTPLTVNFASSCAANGDASIDTGVTTVNGVASATYTATGCTGPDNVTATVVELSGVTASGSLTVADADASSIKFIDADPTTISLQGTGGTGRQEFSNLVFQVIDEAGLPISGERVSISLSTTLGGVNLTGDLDADGDLDNSASDERLTSNASGEVAVIVNSGTVPTSVRVSASITLASGDVITTVSDNLVVSTGLPDNNSFSVSASTSGPAGFELDGFTSDLTIRAADAFNNPVPDGTAINFTTEYGRVDDTCTTVDGDCTVTWNSQSPRTPNFSSTGNVLTISSQRCDSNFDGTADVDSQGVTVSTGLPCPALSADSANVLAITGNARTSVLTDSTDIDFPGQIFGGRSTILVYVIGEESFVDANGNGRYDWIDANNDDIYDVGVESLEEFVDLPEAFLDHNEDGVFGNDVATGGCTSDDGTDQCSGWQEGGAEETFIDFNDNGDYDGDGDGDTANGSVGNGIYNGTLCHEDVEAQGDCTTDLIFVRDELTLLVGGSSPFIGVYDSSNVLQNSADVDVDVSAGGVETRVFYVSDRFNGRLPGGTTVEVVTDNCKILGTSSFEIGDSDAFGNHSFSVTLTEDDAVATTLGSVTITVTPPDSAGGVAASPSFTCTDAD